MRLAHSSLDFFQCSFFGPRTYFFVIARFCVAAALDLRLADFRGVAPNEFQAQGLEGVFGPYVSQT